MARNIRQLGTAGWHFNMTPLIDVTFLLLTYFMLASHYASAERPDINLPKPHQSQAEDRTRPEQIYLNMLYNGRNTEPTLMYGPLRMSSLQEMNGLLMQAGRASAQTQVILRADRQIPYGQVRQVMESIAAADLSTLQVVAELGVQP